MLHIPESVPASEPVLTHSRNSENERNSVGTHAKVIPEFLSYENFQIQMSTLVNQFQQNTIINNKHINDFIWFNIFYNEILSGLRCNLFMQLISGTSRARVSLYGNASSYCYCRKDDTCTYPAFIYNKTGRIGINGGTLFSTTDNDSNVIFMLPGSCSGNESTYEAIVPDWFTSCSPVDALFVSSLTCFYNSSCVQMLIDGFSLGMSGVTIDPRAANVTSLNPMIKSRFTPSTRLDEIISHLFVEEWIYSINFQNYFEKCLPKECVYIHEERFSISYIITTIAGIIGGLSVALRILVPLFVKSIRRIFHYYCTSNEQIEDSENNRRRLATFLIQCRNTFQQMNLYHRIQTNDEILLIKQQRIATRFYILLFLFSIGILFIFLNLNTRINSLTISSPNLSTFEELQAKYSLTLTCRCSNIAISYSAFVSIQPLTYHQICSSDFLSLDFITSLWGMEESIEYVLNYDRKILSSLFRILSSFCILTKNMIEQNIIVFSTKQLITLKTLTRDSFERQVTSIIENFIVQTLAKFQWTHHYIIDMFHANQLQHRFNLNWQSFASDVQTNFVLRSFPVIFNESGQSCFCTTSPSQCFRSLLTSYNRTIQISGIVFGCLPIDGLRQSTLECLFNSTCLTQLADFFYITNFPNVLNRSASSRFNPISSVTIGELIDELFIETWQNSSNYSNYYLSCSPVSCEYSYITRNSILYMITIFLGLYGGLTVGLKLFVWYGLKIYWKVRQYVSYRRRTNQVVPLNSH
ncbi:hypothetical protein I4U23_022616 [Adineta vaga]|nr:hypothetical protein I4U23_022616 [Adineta vaga]